jgi:hypothetical protein
MASNSAARGGSTGLHSGLRTSRIAGPPSRPRAGRLGHGCHVAGAVPGRRRRGEIAAVDRARPGPGGPDEVMSAGRSPDCHAGQVCCAGHGPRQPGPAGGPNRPQPAGSLPTRARAASRVSQVAGGVLTGPRPAYTRARGRGLRQSGRRWGTDGPAASTSRSMRARGPGPDDSDHAIAGAAGRVLRADGSGAAGGLAGRGRTHHVRVCDQVRLCFGSIYSPAGRVRAPQSRCSRCKHA